MSSSANGTRALCGALVLLAAATLGACGSSGSSKGPPGSASNPLVGLPNPSATRTPPTEQPPGEATSQSGSATATHQGSSSAGSPSSSSSKSSSGGAQKQKAAAPSAAHPCSLVTRAQAQAIIGKPIVAPLEAPQGPTCIYQTASRKQYVTLAVQDVKASRLLKTLRGKHTVAVAHRTAYCGTLGKPMLYLPLSGSRVLSVAAGCDEAARFAVQAVSRL